MIDRAGLDEPAARARLYDVGRLLALRRAVRDVADAPEPRALSLAGPATGGLTSVALLSGSFNPPTAAHLELAGAGLASGADAAYFVLATRTIDKEMVTGAALEDRLLLLELLAARDRRLGVLLVNRGLYVDQAAAVRAVLPSVPDVAFLVGHDKIVQIFDPRYYEDRDEALGRLFDLARFLVAPRSGDGKAELTALLDRPENRRFAAAVQSVDLPPSLRDVASSMVRAHVARGSDVAPSPTAILPVEARAFIAETGAYAATGANERYARRLAALDRLDDSATPRMTDGEFRALARGPG